MTALTVACLLVKGPFAYTWDYVTRLERMVRRYLPCDFRFVCLTDQPTSLPGVDMIPVASLAGVVPPNGVGYWNKLRLFDPAIGLTGRVLYLDLDSIIVSDLSPLVEFPASLALTEDAFVVERAHLNTDRYGRRLVRRFNGSVIVFDGGRHAYLWRTWTPKEAERLSTDQDWIGEQAIDARPMPLAWFPRISQVRPPWPAGAKVVLCKKPKNHLAVQQWPELVTWWG